MKNRSKCAIIMVTHNSEKHIAKAIDCVRQQTMLPEKLIIVDSGSRDYAPDFRAFDYVVELDLSRKFIKNVVE